MYGRKSVATKRTSLSVWWDEVNDPEHREFMQVLRHFREELTTKRGYKATTIHKQNLAVLMMMGKALAKSKRPDLLMPRESADVLLERLAAGMYEVQAELQALASKIENGVVVQAGDISRIAGKIQTGYGSFEESITEGFMSFGDDD
jgi:hypothetical protein